MRVNYIFVLAFLTIGGFILFTTLNFQTNSLLPAGPGKIHQIIQTNANISEYQFMKLIRYLKDIQSQIQSINHTLKQNKRWEEYSNYRKELTKKISNFTLPNNIRKANPHIVLDEVQVDCNIRYKLLILVSSNAPHFDRRKKIRAVWGNHSMWIVKEQWKVIFVLGGITDSNVLKKINEEAKLYKDIMLEDVKESFYQLSHKVMIGLHWAYTSFKFDFILKCDDDVFVQVDRVVRKLSGDFKNEGYVGHVMYGQPVERNGRYALTKLEHEKKHFDPYCSGGGFILSYTTIGKIIPLFNWESPLKIDDAYFGELIFKTGVKALHVPQGFYMWNSWCEYDENLLITHPVKSDVCMEFFQKHSLIDNGKLVNDTIKNQQYGKKPKNAKPKKSKT